MLDWRRNTSRFPFYGLQLRRQGTHQEGVLSITLNTISGMPTFVETLPISYSRTVNLGFIQCRPCRGSFPHRPWQVVCAPITIPTYLYHTNHHLLPEVCIPTDYFRFAGSRRHAHPCALVESINTPRLFPKRIPFKYLKGIDWVHVKPFLNVPGQFYYIPGPRSPPPNPSRTTTPPFHELMRDTRSVTPLALKTRGKFELRLCPLFPVGSVFYGGAVIQAVLRRQVQRA